MIDTDKCEHILYDTMALPIGVYNVAEELLAEVKRLRDGIQYWFDTVAHREDDVMVQYFKRLIE